MTRFALMLLLLASEACATDNYIIPGARQEGGQTAVVGHAAVVGTSASGNPIVEPIVQLSGSLVTVTGTGVVRTWTPAVLTTSGSFAAGLKSLDLLVVSGTLSLGAVTLTSGQGFSRSFAPDTAPAIVYTLTGTVNAVSTR